MRDPWGPGNDSLPHTTRTVSRPSPDIGDSILDWTVSLFHPHRLQGWGM